VLLAFLAFNTTGCALIGIVLVPFQLLLSLLGAAGGAVGIADVRPDISPRPIARAVSDEQWLVTNLRPDTTCNITCSAPGRASRTYAWPKDFDECDGQCVVVRLDRNR
jgi:hypothetical protein